VLYSSGDIEAPVKSKETQTGDTLCSFVDFRSEEAVRKSVQAGSR